MSVYLVPCNYGTPEPDSGEFITADSSDEKNNICCWRSRYETDKNN